MDLIDIALNADLFWIQGCKTTNQLIGYRYGNI